MSARRHLQRLRGDERGTTLVELAFVIALFLLMFFMLLDFGRMSYNWVTAEKAVQMAARIAAVRPAVCAGVPQTNQKVAGSLIRYGTACDDPSAPCVAVATATCSGMAGNPTTDAIWARIEPLLPGDATEANLRFTYSYDRDMNFLGGPYVPVVTVELQNLEFQFATPLAGLARVAGATNTSQQEAAERDGIPLPSMSVSLPGEDLALGDAG